MTAQRFTPERSERSDPSALGPFCRVLKSAEEVTVAERRALDLGLCPIPDRAKFWDNLIAIEAIAAAGIELSEPIVDLGCRSGAMLTWLHQLGYRALYGCDLRAPLPPVRSALRKRLWGTAGWGFRMYWAHRKRMRIAPVEATGFRSEAFSAATCMSVIEHGVKVDAFFREASRLLKPGGVLIMSTDYWPHHVDLGDLKRFKEAFGKDRVFNRREISELCSTAAASGLTLAGQPELNARKRVVHSEGYGYTFLTLTFVRETYRSQCAHEQGIAQVVAHGEGQESTG